jgi:acetyltransferase-like isoleucine patch superfamily enzyme
MRTLAKAALHALFLLFALPLALGSLFGRIELLYVIAAQACAQVPGIVGDYLRIAFYHLTLTECALESRIQFGSFFAHPQAKVSRGVYIGSYCILGRTSIGERTQIASGVQILSGARQHSRDAHGRVLGSEQGTFTEVQIGADCWIGAAAVIMADVGAGSTVGAGAVVTKPVPPRTVVAGVPARVVRSREGGTVPDVTEYSA